MYLHSFQYLNSRLSRPIFVMQYGQKYGLYSSQSDRQAILLWSRPSATAYHPVLLRFAGKPQARIFTYQTDPMTGKTIMLNHISTLFRNPDMFGALVSQLSQNFPKGVPIEIYAGAHGEEAISMALCLYASFGKTASNYPVTVSDLYPENFERSLQGIVPAHPEIDKNGLSTGEAWHFLNQKWLKFRETSGGLAQAPLDSLIAPHPLDAEQYEHFLSRNDRNNVDLGRNWHARFQHETLHRVLPDVWNALQKQLRFKSSPVDAVAALSQKPKDPTRPRVVMLRNMVYLLTRKQQAQLLIALAKRLPAGSLLCIGDSEYTKYPRYARYGNCEAYNGRQFLMALRLAGFEKTENRYIWRKLNRMEHLKSIWSNIF